MLCREIIEQIEKRFPEDYAMAWDNVGLLAGRDDKEVRRIYIAVDATDDVVERAVSAHADLLITHHPLIFSGIKRINNRDFIGRRLLKLIQNDISYYAMHTNYDVLGMAELSGNLLKMQNAEVLEVTAHRMVDGEEKEEGIGRVADLTKEMPLWECAQEVKNAFGLPHVVVFGDQERMIRRAAISPGSGKSMIGAAVSRHADVLITGDIGHHEGIDAVAQGLMVIDAGHYGLEHIFVNDMVGYLKDTFREEKTIEVMGEDIRHPFTVL